MRFSGISILFSTLALCVGIEVLQTLDCLSLLGDVRDSSGGSVTIIMAMNY